MFWNKKRYDMQMLKAIRPTSKSALKMQCLMISKGNVEDADKLYKFLSDGVDSLPDFDVVPPTTFTQIKETAGSIFGWVKENQNDIVNGIEFIKTLRNKGGGSIPPTSGGAPLPPL